MSPTVRRLPRFLVLALLSAPALHAQEASDPGAPDLDRLRSEQQALRPQIESAQGPMPTCRAGSARPCSTARPNSSR